MLSRHAQDLADALPDLPRWVETRALLLSGSATVLGAGSGDDAAVVLAPGSASGALVGRVDRALLVDALGGVPADFELLVQSDAVRAAQDVLTGWRVAHAVVHTLPTPFPAGRPDDVDVVVSSAPPHGTWLEDLPEDVRLDAREAEAIAAKRVDGAVVAVCAAGDVTETWWDVGIDTLEGHRRRGHAAACFRALAAVMAQRGRQPVWSAYADYPPSLTLAATLGFRPTDRVAVLSPPRGTSS